MKNDLRLIFWELTSSCNLKCKHCRAEAQEGFIKGELSTKEIIDNFHQIRKFADPIMILTGGEPLARNDFFEIAKECSEIFTRVALASNGTLINDTIAKQIKEVGIQRVSISLDGANSASHDEFRGQIGSFDNAINGANNLTANKISLQINSTITKSNVDDLDKLLNLALELGADAFHAFILVPVGCGIEISDDQRLSPEKLEESLKWLLEKSIEYKDKIHIKATCAPQYYRLLHDSKKQNKSKETETHHGMAAMTRGCLAGSSVCFISSKGFVQPCGYLPLQTGNILNSPLEDIWKNSEVFQNLRNPQTLKGKCNSCGYRKICQGCRARAYAETKDYLSEDPDCIYE